MPDTVHRITLTDDQLATIIDGIAAADTPQAALVHALTTTFNYLLAPEGLTWDDFGPDRRLDGCAYAIPDHQWHAIGEALTALPRNKDMNFGTVNLLLDWMNIGPSGFKAAE